MGDIYIYIVVSVYWPTECTVCLCVCVCMCVCVCVCVCLCVSVCVYSLITQSALASERNSVVVGSNPAQINFPQLLLEILQW